MNTIANTPNNEVSTVATIKRNGTHLAGFLLEEVTKAVGNFYRTEYTHRGEREEVKNRLIKLLNDTLPPFRGEKYQEYATDNFTSLIDDAFSYVLAFIDFTNSVEYAFPELFKKG